jgi:hypothetical protein
MFAATKARVLLHGASLSAPAHLATFLVLGTALETSLPHIAIDFGAAGLYAGAYQVNSGFFAALECADHFVDDAVVDQRL